MQSEKSLSYFANSLIAKKMYVHSKESRESQMKIRPSNLGLAVGRVNTKPFDKVCTADLEHLEITFPFFAVTIHVVYSTRERKKTNFNGQTSNLHNVLKMISPRNYNF